MRRRKQQNHKRASDAIPIGGVWVIDGQELADRAARLKQQGKIPPLADFLRMMAEAGAKAFQEQAEKEKRSSQTPEPSDSSKMT